MAYVVGVDGCRSGWLTSTLQLESGAMQFKIYPHFEEILDVHKDARFLAVDIPIGLRNDGKPRGCDIEARRLLAPARTSCVFPAPPRKILNTTSYQEACDSSNRSFGRKISQQSYAIFPKIAEVDRLITPKIQERVFEVHPEICFWRMNHCRAILSSKKNRIGYEERRSLLSSALSYELPDSWNWLDALPHRPAGANRDDLLDSAVAAYTAKLRFYDLNQALPSLPEVDEKRIRMEIVF